MSRITELREEAGLTQRQLADLIGVDPSTIRNWEKNRNSIAALVRFAKLCEALGCDPSELYSIDDPANE